LKNWRRVIVNPLTRGDDARFASRLLREIAGLAGLADRPLRLMEVCGTHTIAIFRSGIRSLLPGAIELISGPGCPVCVTPAGEIDRAIALSCREDVILATFGDLMRVPGSSASLNQVRAQGGAVRVVLSPLDAVQMAQENPDKAVCFFGVGFETTSPAIAATVKEAGRRGLANFYLLSSQRLIPPAIRALLSGNRVKIDGFILPGHVSVIIGEAPYRFIAEEFGIPGVITGFEPLDILEGIYMLLRQIKEGRRAIEIQYSRAVKEEGNQRAKTIMEEVFAPCDASWRGLGMIPMSGLMLRDEFAAMDAVRVFDLPYVEVGDPPGCLCSEVLQGLRRPPECPLFGTQCTPEAPVGACMVSTEGSCAAYYKYGGSP
jgi:hydrogenase expression/formation protein HypD